MFVRWWQKLDLLFPEQDILKNKLPFPVALPLFIILAILFSFVATLIPADGFFAFDWVHFFGIQRVPPFYPPWTVYVVQILTYPLLVGITLAAFSLATIQRSVHPISAIAAFFSLPLLWTVFLGQLEGLVVLGLLGLPWLVPLSLLKPQIAVFALGAKRSYLLGLLFWLIISLLIWGNWPNTMFSAESFYAEGRYEQNIGLGWWGLPVFLLTIWYSRGDMDMLMASGAFISPHVIFYNLLPLTPAIARLKPRAAIIALFLSFLTLSSNWFGALGWWLGWGFVPWIWLNLAAQRYPDCRYLRWLRVINS